MMAMCKIHGAVLTEWGCEKCRDAARAVREARAKAERARDAERAAELFDRRELVTYRNADGSHVGGEFAHVGEPDFWDDADELTAVVRERWLLVDREFMELPEWLAEDRRTAAMEEADMVEHELGLPMERLLRQHGIPEWAIARLLPEEDS